MSRRRRIARRLVRWTEHLLAVFGLFFIVYHVCFDLSVMTSGSMSPTIRGTSEADGDWVLTEKVSYRLRRPRRWEIVTFRSKDQLQVMKRVAGVPGETVAIHDKAVRVDGGAVERPGALAALSYFAYGCLKGGRTAACGDGYFVLGDHSVDSFDSRFEGPVKDKQIIGRAWLVVWPPSRIRFLSP
jgi:signal peptidase I